MVISNPNDAPAGTLAEMESIIETAQISQPERKSWNSPVDMEASRTLSSSGQDLQQSQWNGVSWVIKWIWRIEPYLGDV